MRFRCRRSVWHPGAVPLPRVVAIVCVLAAVGVVGAGLVAGPAGAAGVGDLRTTCGPKATLAIQSAFREVFDRGGSLDASDRARYVTTGTSTTPDLRVAALLATWLAEPHGNTESVAFGTIRCEGRRAIVDAQVVYAGQALAPGVVPAGEARHLGKLNWRITVATLCDRVTLTDPRLASTPLCAR